jgi:hypothetical protein
MTALVLRSCCLILRVLLLDWLQTELSFAINQGGKFPTWFNSYCQFVAELHSSLDPEILLPML